MKRTIVFSTLIFLFVAFTSCQFIGPSVQGNNRVTEETRQISGFDRLKAATGLEVILIPDSTQYVVVEADENLHDYIRTDLKGTTLDIYAEGRIKATCKRVYVHCTQLSELQSSSGCTITTKEPLKAATLSIDASSGSQQFLTIDAQTVESQCSSGAQIQIAGKCKRATVRASSGANYRGREFTADACEADVSSGANVWIAVQQSLTAEASSGGTIRYSGAPAQTQVHSSSGGSIIRD